MPEKLMTLRELSEYLRVPEDRLTRLVEDRVIPAYRIGGELLRFRKEQIDAMRREIDARVDDSPRQKIPAAQSPGKKSGRPVIERGNNFFESVSDFFYFNDFYILSAAIAGILLAVIFMG
ncbi:MAG TPA: helix-turn-helix domain-containing protein [Candidatus Omnitrophota bacterium]|nr:helix-turn-helix domain-containing protein [Candidatus Omnitrophota bacterium]